MQVQYADAAKVEAFNKDSRISEDMPLVDGVVVDNREADLEATYSQLDQAWHRLGERERERAPRLKEKAMTSKFSPENDATGRPKLYPCKGRIPVCS